MAYEHITTYLNDHLAGSVAALELLDSLESAHAKTTRQKFFAELRADVWEDRHELEALMRQLKVEESSTRKASAWLTEKLTELKMRLDDPKDGPMRMLEALEALSLGIEGKRLLWLTLTITASYPFHRRTAARNRQRLGHNFAVPQDSSQIHSELNSLECGDLSPLLR